MVLSYCCFVCCSGCRLVFVDYCPLLIVVLVYLNVLTYGWCVVRWFGCVTGLAWCLPLCGSGFWFGLVCLLWLLIVLAILVLVMICLVCWLALFGGFTL